MSWRSTSRGTIGSCAAAACTKTRCSANRSKKTEYELQQEDAFEDGLPEGAPLPAIDPERLVYNQHLKLIPGDGSIDNLLRYEAQVRRALSQDMTMLEVHQARRRGERTPLARVQFNSGLTLTKPTRPQRTTAADVRGLQEIRARVRLAEIGLAERKLARAEKTAHA